MTIKPRKDGLIALGAFLCLIFFIALPILFFPQKVAHYVYENIDGIIYIISVFGAILSVFFFFISLSELMDEGEMAKTFLLSGLLSIFFIALGIAWFAEEVSAFFLQLYLYLFIYYFEPFILLIAIIGFSISFIFFIHYIFSYSRRRK